MIRRGNLEDFDILFKWINDEDVIKFSRYGKEMNLEEFNSYFDDRIDKLFILEEDLFPIGQICYDLIDNEGIINYCVDKEERGKGYGKELVKYLVAFVKENIEEIDKLSAFVHKNNIPSIKIFESLGFIREVEKDDYIKFAINIR
ncbi:GNAT family N-acetyltransferase [Eubacterium multiforme]|uniref:RimJ/RimL family protein N-acetyltransferase n=1 Tax=Eubacterium multiforme TaxID=83339 RepID=A0ABT9UR94_9FIRM|nr:GNAT family N-acetyltransferase [Eubacterium multiforme]MDQ0148245.1 RimJ/RimL family protein N-acetyltransferase [Eubacterium multiforme]